MGQFPPIFVNRCFRHVTRQAFKTYVDMRAKFYLPGDGDTEAKVDQALASTRKIIICAQIVNVARDPSCSDGVKKMSAMKRVQAKIRSLRLLPKDLPPCLREQYQPGLAME